MNKALLILTLTAGLFPLTAEAKDARCLIKQNGSIAYSGSCQFRLGEGGSFSISRHDGKHILPSITDIFVYIVSPGIAEVRGLTINGNNSRWGSAMRSKKDPACWMGSDFEICAY